MKRLLPLVVLVIGAVAWIMLADRSVPPVEDSEGVVAASVAKRPETQAVLESVDGTGAVQPRVASNAPPGTVHGVVRVAGERSGLGGIELRLEPVDGTRGERRSSLEDGSFLFADVSPGAYQLRADPPRPFASVAHGLEVKPGADSQVDVLLETWLTLAVHVTDATPAAGTDRVAVRPIPAAQVALVRPADDGEEVLTVRSDERGVAQLEGIPTEALVLRVRAEDFAPFEQLLHFDPAGYAEDSRLHGRPFVVGLHSVTVRVSGQIVGPDGKGLPGALICLDTRTRAGSIALERERPGVRPGGSASMPHGVSNERGAFELALLEGFSEQSLLVCPGRAGLPLVFRRPLSLDEVQAREPVFVQLGEAGAVDLRVTQPDGSPAQGTLQVSDGIVTHDLEQDSVLGGVLGIESWNRIERSPGRLRLDLLPGVYKVLFTASGGARKMQAFFVTITDDGPQEKLLVLEDD